MQTHTLIRTVQPSHAVLILTVVLAYSSPVVLAQTTPTGAATAKLNQQLTSAAWKALHKGDFREAAETAQKCIETFEANAVKLQKQLEAARTRVPMGAVTEDERNAVNRNGLLNDVATCYYIKGKALEQLKQREAAIAAYKAAATLTYARAWDPAGPWFWSPAEAAAERLGESR
jgi:tetratricopeptide (TPR) repeat protein